MPQPDNEYWIGFADAKPDETIQRHALTVAVIFSSHPKKELLALPIKQYKNSRQKNKARDAERLTDWLRLQKAQGLELSGFISAVNQTTAARFGLEVIESIADIATETNFEGYRLRFECDYIDLPQAVALGFYFFVINMGAIRPAAQLPIGRKKLFVAMDRFPGASIGKVAAGQQIPITQGQKFLNFLRRKSPDAIGMDANRSEKGIELEFGTLDWWTPPNSQSAVTGKFHPNFLLTDWFLASAFASAFGKEFLQGFSNERQGIDAKKALEQLYLTFKQFDLWSIDDAAMQFIKSSNRIWLLPEDARRFVLARTV